MKSRFLGIFLFIAAAGLDGQSEPPGLFGVIVHLKSGDFAERLRDKLGLIVAEEQRNVDALVFTLTDR